MYDNYVGKIMSEKEIFNTFIDCYVVGERVYKINNENEYGKILIKFIREYLEEAEFRDKICYSRNSIFHGKRSRKGMQVIEGSNIRMEEIVGQWHVRYSNEPGQILKYTLVIRSTGNATLYYGLYFPTHLAYKEFTWYVEDDIFTFESSEYSISYRGMVNSEFNADEEFHYFFDDGKEDKTSTLS